ncbi:sugar-binding protein [Flavobacterium sp. NKUCC04_CG]|uniref:sugar-binding protein n=1 Tax=Flavobacterium sp. NKUCC04_CG TaxID=2842121 RepID=UPI001C5B4464|nr:sugar-binding protein [Flavobacterium sp. NKUCC04_CG]MBW3518757.1 sugar-binding protein [Flavobacterium sp. NKUCC04_CG]
MKNLYFLLLAWVTTNHLYGQLHATINGSQNHGTVTLPNSPTASSFRVFGDFPPSNFIGVADVGIPLYTISHRDFEFPLTLKYHNGMGNKVEAQPGVTGLGWHLTSGGTITLLESKKRIDVPSSGPIIVNQEHVINNDYWNTKSYLTQILGGTSGNDMTSSNNKKEKSLLGAVYSVNFNGFSGEIYFDHQNKPKFRSKEGVYFDVKINFANKLITVPLFDNETARIEYRHEVYSFILIDSNGIVYVFGTNDTAIELSTLGHNYDLPSLTPAIRNVPSAYEDWKNAVKTIPTTWHLTSINFLNGERITFDYIRQQPIYSSRVYSHLKTGEIDLGDNNVPDLQLFEKKTRYINDEQATMILPALLSSIVTPKETIEFDYKISENHHRYSGMVYDNMQHDRSSDYDLAERADKNILFVMTDVNPKKTSFYELTRPIKKIERIRILNSEKKLFKAIDLNYKASSFERAKLSSLGITGYTGDVAGQTQNYFFKYDMPVSESPDYHTYNKDDYGFYNSKSGYLGYWDDIQNIPEERFDQILQEFKNNATARNAYTASRKPEVSRFNTWEILTDIVYPTGGYTKFEYEPNRYGGIAKNYNASHNTVHSRNAAFVVEPYEGTDNIAGGVRIKRVRNFDSDNKLLSSKSYAYVHNYQNGNTKSSGVLAHVPTYFDFISGNTNVINFRGIEYFAWSTNDIYPAGRLRGNHITYSEVTEIDDVDHSFTTYKYKNFDNGFHDSINIDYATHHENDIRYLGNKEIWNVHDLISMDLERGQLLSKTLFKAKASSNQSKGDLLKAYTYEYNDSSSRFEEYIRTINLYDNHLLSQQRGLVHAYTYIASKIYTYTPYLKKETIIDYPNGNSLGLINSETTYQYHDKYKNITRKTVKTADKTYRTTYKYPYDFSGVYADMTSRNLVAPVIEQREYLNNVRTSTIKTNFRQISPDFQLWKPASIEIQHRNGPWEKQMEFLEYDDKGNLLSVRNKTGLVTNYIYGYNKTLPIWQIENVSYQTISNALGATDINGFSNSSKPNAIRMSLLENKMNQNALLKRAFISKFLYDPMLGLIYKKTASGLIEYYKYDESGRLKQVEDANNNTTIKYEYNYKQN